jgi:hypothetical protein
VYLRFQQGSALLLLLTHKKTPCRLTALLQMQQMLLLLPTAQHTQCW